MIWRQAQVAGDTVVQEAGDTVAQGLSPEAVQALEGLNDIVVPTSVAWTPTTAGWYALLAVVVVSVGWISFVRHRTRVANRYRRDALEELAAIEGALGEHTSRADALAGIPQLIKRVALSVASRAQAASLTGDAWLAFLDQAYGGDGFSSGPGRLIPELAYKPPERLEDVTEQQARDLLELVGVWIRSHDLSMSGGD